jgi:plasmid stabilization system protein ParE
VNATVWLTESAREDLLAIWLYVFEQAGSDTRADRVIRSIQRTLDILAEQPTIAAPREWLPEEVLAFASEGYLITFRRRSGGIEVLRVTGAASELDGAP